MRRVQDPSSYPPGVPGQLSFLAADFAPPSVDDLEGMLLGTGHVVRIGGTARLSVLVDAVAEPRRVDALLAAYADGGLRREAVPGDEPGQVSARTPFNNVLRPLAERWVRGAIKAVPIGFRL